MVILLLEEQLGPRESPNGVVGPVAVQQYKQSYSFFVSRIFFVSMLE